MKEIAVGFFKTGVASILSTVFGMVSTKIIAVMAGPTGVGIYSLLKQILLLAMTFGTAGGQSALIQGVSSRTGRAKSEYQDAVLQIFVICTLVVALILYFFSGTIAHYCFGSLWLDKIVLVKWLILPVIITVLMVYLTSVLNAYRSINSLAIGQIAGAITGALLAYPVAYYVNHYSALAFAWYIAATSFVVAMVYAINAYQNGWLLTLHCALFVRLDMVAARHFFSIAFVTLITGLVATGGLLFVKALIANSSGLSYAGLFDVSWTISMIYLSLILNSFSTHYLPKLSESIDPGERCKLVNDVMRLCIIIMVPIIVTLVVFKSALVSLAYSEKFIESTTLMRWMLIGDYFKVTAWVLSVSALAKAEMRVIFWTNILWWAGFALTVVMINTLNLDLQYMGLGYMLLYSVYLLYFYLRARQQGEIKGSRPLISSWMIGLSIIVLSSILTWNMTSVNLFVAAFLILSAFFVSYTTMHKSERMYIISTVKRMVRYE